MSPALTFPSVPGDAAVTVTSRVWHVIWGGLPGRVATATKTASSVENATPACVRTLVPAGIWYERVGSQLVQRTDPVAFVSSTFLPVAGNVSDTDSGHVSRWAGT